MVSSSPDCCAKRVSKWDIEIGPESLMGGPLGINKTYSKITKHFYLPQIRHCVAEFYKTFHTCQMVGKPNQKIPVAPLKPIPAFEEPFSKVIIDCVGLLPKLNPETNIF